MIQEICFGSHNNNDPACLPARAEVPEGHVVGRFPLPAVFF